MRIKIVFSNSYCCYDNALCHENNNNVFTNDSEVFFDAMIVASTDNKNVYNDSSKSKYRNVLKTVLSHAP